MNLQDFINTKIKKGVSEYDYFEIEKTNPTEYGKLTGLELQYLENGYVIYKQKSMDYDYKIHTYIFRGSELYLSITNYCDTKENKYDFYTNDTVKKSVWYFMDTKSTHIEYDKYGKKILKVNFPKSSLEKLSGCRWINTYKDRFNIIDKLQLERNVELERIELTLSELEKYI